MRVLVVGAGEVGYHLAERLSEENQDVVIIESDPERADFASQHLDVLTGFSDAGKLVAHLNTLYPLEQTAAAFAESKAGHVVGKVAIAINGGR